MMGRQALKPRVVQAVFILIRFAKKVVKIIRVYVEPTVMCVLDVVIQVTESKTVLTLVYEVSIVVLQLSSIVRIILVSLQVPPVGSVQISLGKIEKYLLIRSLVCYRPPIYIFMSHWIKGILCVL